MSAAATVQLSAARAAPSGARTRAALLAGGALLLCALLPVLLGRYFVRPEMAAVFSDVPNLSPSLQHPLGTQSEGRDLLAELMLAIPSTLLIALIGGGLAALFGGLLGILAGFRGGSLDALIRIVVDACITIPPLALLILIAALLPAISVPAMGLVLAATGWISVTRVLRSQVLTLRERAFVRAARLSGAGALRLMLLEIAPNLIPVWAACTVNAISSVTLAAIGLQVLGLGPRQAYTLGNMLYEALSYTAMFRNMWWWWLPPILVLVLIFLALFFLSSALDRWANPRLERVG